MDEIVAVVTDLFFQARISAAARAAGRRVRFVSRVDDIPTEGPIGLALVDLDAGLDVPEAIRRLSGGSQARIVAFGPHLDTDSRKRARAAGAHRVLAKSRFVTELPRIVDPGADGAPRGSTASCS